MLSDISTSVGRPRCWISGWANDIWRFSGVRFSLDSFVWSGRLSLTAQGASYSFLASVCLESPSARLMQHSPTVAEIQRALNQYLICSRWVRKCTQFTDDSQQTLEDNTKSKHSFNLSSGIDLKRKPLSHVQIHLLSWLLKHYYFSYFCELNDVYVCKMSQVMLCGW